VDRVSHDRGFLTSNQSLASPVDDRMTLRAFRDSADFEIVARIRNDAARKHGGDRITPVDATLMGSLVSSPERFCIAQVGEDPAGFVFVAGAGTQQLDEFGTIEGKSWLIIGPTCGPAWHRRGIEKELLAWLLAYAREVGIDRLIKFAGTGSAHEYLNQILAEAGFREILRYYRMRLEMTRPRRLRKNCPMASNWLTLGAKRTWTSTGGLAFIKFLNRQ
jgi:GNAT superfamily N-acetyltransferase